MRWLMVCLLASLALLLTAAAAAARHIRAHRARIRRQPASRFDTPQETDLDH